MRTPPRSRSQGAQVREFGNVLSARREDARHERWHVRRADDLPLAAADDRHRRRAGLLRLPVAPVERHSADGARLRARARCEARRQRHAVGHRSRAEARRQAGGRRALRSRAASHASLAHDPRVDRASHRARSRDGLRGQLRRHELRLAAGEDARPVQVRPRDHEHPGRSHAARLALRRAAGTTRASFPTPSSSSRTESSTTIRPRASRRRGSTGGTRSRGSRRARTAARTRSRGRTCSSSACRTSRCCRARRSSRARTSSPPPTAASRSSATGRFSIDQQRYNAQFGGQLFYEIKGGKIVGMLKDVAYQMRTPDFWNSMDMIGGKKSYFSSAARSTTARDSRASRMR